MQTKTQQAPRTKAELQALYAKREELQQQLESVTERRGQLVQQRLNAQAAGNRTVAAEYEAQIAQLGSRQARLEADKLRADDMIADAVGRGVGREGEATTATEVAPAAPAAPAFPAFPPVPGFEWAGEVPGRSPPANFVRNNAVPLMLGEALFFVLMGTFFWRRLSRRAVAQPAAIGQLTNAVDAIAVEVERISENQRYVTKLLSEKLEPGVGPAQLIKAKDRLRSD